jgi:hypothetical protein
MEENIESLDAQHIQEALIKPLAVFYPNIGMISVAGIAGTSPDKTKLQHNPDIKEMKDYAEVFEGNFENSQEVGLGNSMETLDQLITNESQFVVHGRDGSYLMDKCNWPKLSLPSEKNMQDSEGVEDLTQ